MADYVARFYPESRFGGFPDIDGTITFYLRVNSLVGPQSVVLDVGCGRGQHAADPIQIRRRLRIFKGRCRKVIGIDVDPEGAENPFIDEFRPIVDKRWPVADESVDVSICDSVVEHLDDPAAFFGELARVTRPGGFICIRTPNLLSYFGLGSLLIPNAMHLSMVRKLQAHSVAAADVFPTLYRCNTRGRLRRMLAEHGFDHCVYGYEPEPSYASFSVIAYMLGVLHQKFAPSRFKVCLLAFGRKAGSFHEPLSRSDELADDQDAPSGSLFAEN